MGIRWKFCAFKYFMKTEHPRIAQSMRAATRVQFRCESDSEWRRLKLTHAWQLRIMTDKSSLLTDATNYAQWLRLLQVRAMHGWHLLAPEVQLMTSVGGPCMCVVIVTTIWWVLVHRVCFCGQLGLKKKKIFPLHINFMGTERYWNEKQREEFKYHTSMTFEK